MIAEPSTLLTDYAVAMLAAWLAWHLRRAAGASGQRAVRLWSFGFAATALGGLAGGTYHGFQANLPAPAATAIWTATTVAVGLAACLLLSAVLTATGRPPLERWLLAGVWVQFAAYVVWMWRHDDFRYVIVEYGAAMLFVVLLLVATPAGRRSPGAGRIAAGVVVTIAAAAVQQSGFDLHRNLNHNDLQHLIQMAGMWLLYTGGMKLPDARRS